MRICEVLNCGSNVVFSNQEALKQQNFSSCEKFLGVALFVICSVFSLSGYFVHEYFKHKKIKRIQTQKLEQQPTAEKADKAFKEFNKKEAQVQKPLQVQKNLPKIQVKQNPEIPLEKVQVIEKDKQVPKEKVEVQQDPPLALEKKQESPAPKIEGREDFLRIIIIKIVHGERAGNQVALNSNSFIQKEIDIGDRVKFTPQKFEEIKARIGLNNPDEEFEVVNVHPPIENNVEREEQEQQKEEVNAVPVNKVNNPVENLGVQVQKEVRAIDLENAEYKQLFNNFDNFVNQYDQKRLNEEREESVNRRFKAVKGLQKPEAVNALEELPAKEKILYIRKPDGSIEYYHGDAFIDTNVKVGEHVKFTVECINRVLKDHNPDAEYEVVGINKLGAISPFIEIKFPNEKLSAFNLDHFNERQVKIGQKIKFNPSNYKQLENYLKAIDENINADSEFEIVKIG